MANDTSTWHVNDVVAYDLMRDAATTLQARLIDLARNGDTAATAQLIAVRRETLAIDGYDRAAVDAHTRELAARTEELGPPPHDTSSSTPPAPDEAADIYRAEIRPLLFGPRRETREESPTLVLLGGQPGAGRSRAGARLTTELGDIVTLTGDDLRAFYPPGNGELRPSGPGGTDARVEAARTWVRNTIQDAIESRRSLLIEGTFGDPEATLDTADRFRRAGFTVRLVAIASPRVLSVTTITSRYLRTLHAGTAASFTSLPAHDRGYNGTGGLLDSLNPDSPVDRVTVVSRTGRVLFDQPSAEPGGSEPARARDALEVGRHPGTWGARSTMELLGELKQITAYAIGSHQLTADVAELLAEAHRLALDNVVPRLNIDADSPQARFIGQAVSEQSIALRRAVDAAQPGHEPPSMLELPVDPTGLDR